MTMHTASEERLWISTCCELGYEQLGNKELCFDVHWEEIECLGECILYCGPKVRMRCTWSKEEMFGSIKTKHFLLYISCVEIIWLYNLNNLVGCIHFTHSFIYHGMLNYSHVPSWLGEILVFFQLGQHRQGEKPSVASCKRLPEPKLLRWMTEEELKLGNRHRRTSPASGTADAGTTR